MVFNICGGYERHKEDISLMIKLGQLRPFDFDDLSGDACYFCGKSILDKGRIVFYDDCVATERIVFHSNNCLESSIGKK